MFDNTQPAPILTAAPKMPPCQEHSRAGQRVKIEQPVPTVENTSGEFLKRSVARWHALVAMQAADGYGFVCSYQGIITFSAGRDWKRRPDRHFTTNLAHELVPCDLWGHALTT